jgi:glycosyltransferase involved in cell wall biosynthesis
MRRFGQALVLAAEMPGDVRHLHAHFLHTPASVTRYAALLLGLPWTGSAHAKDIWTTPEWEKREKLASCGWLVTCTAANHAHLSAIAPPDRVELVYHGLDLSRFDFLNQKKSENRGDDPANPVAMLSVGRLVEKKGTDVLLEALARLPAELSWRLVHVGGGPLKEKLARHARRLGIADRVQWRGARTQVELLAEYRAADLFALASRVARDGDRDGLPNVLVEAQSQGLACVATRVSGIPELIDDGVTGLLVEPEAPQKLAQALELLMREPARRHSIGAAGRQKVREKFGLDGNIARLARRFGLSGAE